MKKVLIAFIVALLFTSCGSSNQNNGQVTMYYEVQIIPPLQNGYAPSSSVCNRFTMSAVYGLNWNGAIESESLSIKKSDDFMWYSGNLPISIFFGNAYDKVCRSVKIDTYVDGSVLDSRTYIMGVDTFNNNCDDGISVSYNLIIP